MNIKQFLLSIMILTLSNFAPNINAQGVSINQGRVYFNGIPGETQTKEIILTNPTNEKVLFQLSPLLKVWMPGMVKRE